MRRTYLHGLALLVMASIGCGSISRPPAVARNDASPGIDGGVDKAGGREADVRLSGDVSPRIDSRTNQDTALAADTALSWGGNDGSTGGSGGGGAPASSSGVIPDAAVAADRHVSMAGSGGSGGISGSAGTTGKGGSPTTGGTSGPGGTSGSGLISRDGGLPDVNQDSPPDGALVLPDAAVPDAPAIDPDASVVVTPADTNTALSCPMPSAPLHGTVSVTSLAVGGVAAYSCSLGRSLSGPSARTCQPDGTWSGAVPVCQSIAPNIVFITSTQQTANLGGLSGADSLCAARALAAGLSGTYKAWLSTSTVDAKDRLGAASGWVRPDGKPVLNRIEDIAAERVVYPPCLDEFGNDPGIGIMLTGSDVTGKRVDHSSRTTCADFTSAVDEDPAFLDSGLSTANSSNLASGYAVNCSTLSRIYCFGIDRAAQISPEPATTGRRAFVTNATWLPGAGMASADALCQQEASDAGLTGSFKALLASTTASAASRFNSAGAPWVRSDGIPLSATASTFFTASKLTVAPNINAKGDGRFAGVAWAGAGTMNAVGTEATTCGNWMSTAPISKRGLFDNTDRDYFFGNANPSICAFPSRLVCLQE